MKDLLIRLFMAFNLLLIRLSRGRMGSKLGSQNILILHTVGRKTGLDRAIPVAYFDFEGGFLIVGSNWGGDRQAEWFLNLKKQPKAKVEVKGMSIPVRMVEARGKEFNRLWKFATLQHPPYLEYQKKTKRQIPIVMLKPL
jgi:deazaflavin-dependent oxidoreductase (nitroreductase family)